MRTLLQRHPKSCGATVIAIVSGVSLAQAEQVRGVHATSTRQLVQGLRACGVRCDAHLTRVSRTAQPSAGDVVHIKWSNKRGHWAVRARAGYIDPAYGRVMDIFYDALKGRVTSFLRVH